MVNAFSLEVNPFKLHGFKYAIFSGPFFSFPHMYLRILYTANQCIDEILPIFLFSNISPNILKSFISSFAVCVISTVASNCLIIES